MGRYIRREEGFTLIELLIVILIIGILVVISLPAFLNQQDKVKDSDAQQTLSVGYRAARANFTSESPTFLPVSGLVSDIAASEPQIIVEEGVDTDDITDVGTLWVLSSGTGQDDLLLGILSLSGTVFTLTVTDSGPPTIVEIV